VNEKENRMRDMEAIEPRPQMWMDKELDVSSVREEMIGPHVERRESTLLQLPEPEPESSKYVLLDLPHSVYIPCLTE
jgi:hypothetical protein